MDLLFKNISEQAVERYNHRYQKHGFNVLSLGWGSVEQQEYRFSQTLSQYDPSTKALLDIGCGFADYYDYLKRQNCKPERYIGWDINHHFIAKAQERYIEDSRVILQENDLVDLECQAPLADVGIMLGLLNYNLKDPIKNYNYSMQMIAKAFGLVKEMLIVDFLSVHKIQEYPEEDFVFYHDPALILEEALKLTPLVQLKHDYLPIPQREFMLVLKKCL